MRDLTIQGQVVRLLERHAVQFHVRLCLLGRALRLAETACQEQVVGAAEHGGERIDMAEGDQFARRFSQFLPEFPVRCLDRRFVRLDADHLQGGPVNRVCPLAHEPDISVLPHRDHAGAVFDYDKLVNRLGAVGKDDAIFAKPHKIPLVNKPTGQHLDEVPHHSSIIASMPPQMRVHCFGPPGRGRSDGLPASLPELLVRWWF